MPRDIKKARHGYRALHHWLEAEGLRLADLPTLAVELVAGEGAAGCVIKSSKGSRTRLLPGLVHVPRGLARRIGGITKRVMRKRLRARAVEGFHDRVDGRPRGGHESK
jgi:hypothetical protein